MTEEMVKKALISVLKKKYANKWLDSSQLSRAVSKKLKTQVNVLSLLPQMVGDGTLDSKLSAVGNHGNQRRVYCLQTYTM